MSNSYGKIYQGNFQGMLQWQQLDALWAVVRAQPNGWYLLSKAKIDNQKQDLPQAPMPADQFLEQLDDINSHLRKKHKQSFCGIVYADDAHAPNLIKVYDPEGLGSMCSISTKPTEPLYVLTRLQPEPLKTQTPAASARAWWKF